MDPSFLAASSSIAVDDTPRRRCLKLEFNKLSRQMTSKKKQVKTLQQVLRRKEKKNCISKKYYSSVEKRKSYK